MRYLAVLLLFLAGTAHAVGGYKGLKFGASKAEVMAVPWCEFIEQPSDGGGVDMLWCYDFKFGGEESLVIAYLINDKFFRLAVDVDTSMVSAVLDGLVEKYGAPSSSSTQPEFALLDSAPSRSAFMSFDDDTVQVRMRSDESMQQFMMLVYTSPLFDSLRTSLQKNRIEGDL